MSEREIVGEIVGERDRETESRREAESKRCVFC